jgi:hypothetical protein
MEIKYFKLFSGEEIITRAKKVESGWYVEDPATIVHLKDYKLGLANWLPYTKIKDGAVVPDSAILMHTDVADDMVQYYGTWADPDMVVNPEDVKTETEPV